jgi:hypothetical protein
VSRSSTLGLVLLLVLLAGLLGSCGPARVRCEFPVDGMTCPDGTACLPSVDGCMCGCQPTERCAVVSAGAGQDLHPICVQQCAQDAECAGGEKCKGTAVPCASCSAQYFICQ